MFAPQAEGMNESFVSGCVRDGRRRSWIAILRSARQFLATHTDPVSRSLSGVTEDPEWAIAMSVPIAPDAVGLPGGILGAVTARRHPTGWFIVARHRADMSSAEVAGFGHFVCVRIYLLLRYGPGPDTWTLDGSGDHWRASLPAQTPLQEPHVPEFVPVSWTITR